MTVRELIKALKKYPPDAEAIVRSTLSGYTELNRVELGHRHEQTRAFMAGDEPFDAVMLS